LFLVHAIKVHIFSTNQIILNMALDGCEVVNFKLQLLKSLEATPVRLELGDRWAEGQSRLSG
jgi:hypothetical protein